MTIRETMIAGILTIPAALIGYGVMIMFALDAFRIRRRRRSSALPILTRR